MFVTVLSNGLVLVEDRATREDWLRLRPNDFESVRLIMHWSGMYWGSGNSGFLRFRYFPNLFIASSSFSPVGNAGLSLTGSFALSV